MGKAAHVASSPTSHDHQRRHHRNSMLSPSHIPNHTAARARQRDWIAEKHTGRLLAERAFLSMRVGVFLKRKEEKARCLTEALAEAHLAISLTRRLRHRQGGIGGLDLMEPE